jgi:hypothetical protein
MGTWDSTNFGNDEAADWIAGFQTHWKMASLRAALAKGLRSEELENWGEALAAAEIVALLRGHPCASTTEDLLLQAPEKQKKLPAELVDLALQMAEHAKQHGQSEANRAMWFQDEGLSSWISTQDSLIHRLQLSPKALEKKEATCADNFLLTWVYGIKDLRPGPMEGQQRAQNYQFHYPREQALADSISLSHPPDFVSIDCDQKLPQHLWEELALWLEHQHFTRLRLTRFSGSLHTDNATLSLFLKFIQPWVTHLELHIGKIKLAALAQSPLLKTLVLRGNGKAVDIGVLSSLVSLEKLDIRDASITPQPDVFLPLINLKSLALHLHKPSEQLPAFPPSLVDLTLIAERSSTPTNIDPIFELPELRRLAVCNMNIRASGHGPISRLKTTVFQSTLSASYELLLRMPHVEILYPCDLDQEGLASVLPKLKELRHLALYHDHGIHDLDSLKLLPNLTGLDLSHNKKIDNIPPLPALRYLGMCMLPVTDYTFLEGMPMLQELKLFTDGLSNEGCQSISKLTGLKRFTYYGPAMPQIEKAFSRFKPLPEVALHWFSNLTRSEPCCFDCDQSGWSGDVLTNFNPMMILPEE